MKIIILILKSEYRKQKCKSVQCDVTVREKEKIGKESDWKREWEPMRQEIGQDFSTGEESAGADVIEKGAIRKFLEPLEFDSPLHYDEAVAKEYGYEDVI